MENIWHLRKVADTSAKACMICFKPSSSVLITPDNKDFFYICPAHLKDPNFCAPTESEAASIAERKRKEDLNREIEKIKQEYDAKLRKKEEKRKAKKADKAKDDANKDKDKESDAADEKEKDDKIKALTANQGATASAQVEDGPRIFALKKCVSSNPPSALPTTQLTYCRHFYQLRVEKVRNAEIARRNRDRLRNPALFPSVPSGPP